LELLELLNCVYEPPKLSPFICAHFSSVDCCTTKIFAAMFDDPWKIKMLRNDIGVFTEKGGTIAFLLSKKGIVVVDSQFPEQSQHLIEIKETK